MGNLFQIGDLYILIKIDSVIERLYYSITILVIQYIPHLAQLEEQEWVCVQVFLSDYNADLT